MAVQLLLGAGDDEAVAVEAGAGAGADAGVLVEESDEGLLSEFAPPGVASAFLLLSLDPSVLGFALP